MATHSSILARKIPWTEESGGLQSTGSQSQTQLSMHTPLQPKLGSKGCCCCCLVTSVVSSSVQPHGLCSPGSSAGNSQGRSTEWVAVPSSRGSSPPWDRTQVCYPAGRFFTTEPPGKLPTEGHNYLPKPLKLIQLPLKNQNFFFKKKESQDI